MQKRWFYCGLFLSFLIFSFLSACQKTPSPQALPTSTTIQTRVETSPTASLPATEPDASPTADTRFEDARAAWDQSDHNAGYDLEKGPNTYCARCHSPANWDPAAEVDSPPNCVSCKFPQEDEPRIAEGNPLVPEEDWVGIDCAVCHTNADDELQSSLSWYDVKTGYQETIQTPADLCMHCHVNSEPFLFHARELGDSVHKGFDCTDCHDPHSTEASCLSSGCHHVPLGSSQDCEDCHSDVMGVHSMEMLHSLSLIHI